MKTLLLTCLAVFCYTLTSAQYVILNFEDSNLPLDTFVTASTSNPDSSFQFSGLEFPSIYNPSYGGFWAGGWALSTSRNDTTGDFSNLVGAATGSGFNGSSAYLVGQIGAYILLPAGSEYAKVYATNTTYTANVLENGSMFSRPFGIDTSGVSGVPDSLVLALTAYSDGQITQEENLYLADYRANQDSLDYIVRNWISNDNPVASLEFYPADSIAFQMYSSDNGSFGNNTPNFFAIDALYVILGTSGTNDLMASNPLKVWPNPASQYIHIGEGGDNVQLHIADMSGRLVRFYPSYSLGQTVDLSGLPAGNYTAVTMGAALNGAAQIIIK
ncbi:MAG: DUF4465 domain-containing protein [Saprospiraceae bacterium]